MEIVIVLLIVLLLILIVILVFKNKYIRKLKLDLVKLNYKSSSHKLKEKILYKEIEKLKENLDFNNTKDGSLSLRNIRKALILSNSDDMYIIKNLLLEYGLEVDLCSDASQMFSILASKVYTLIIVLDGENMLDNDFLRSIKHLKKYVTPTIYIGESMDSSLFDNSNIIYIEKNKMIDKLEENLDNIL